MLPETSAKDDSDTDRLSCDPHVRFHDLRHSTATLLLSLGKNPKVVQELLGHSQIAVTMDIYSHALPTMQREAMDDLNRLLSA